MLADACVWITLLHIANDGIRRSQMLKYNSSRLESFHCSDIIIAFFTNKMRNFFDYAIEIENKKKQKQYYYY